MAEETNGMAVAALVCGITGVVLGLIPLFFVAAWALGVLAWVFGVVGRRRAPARGGRTMATWGVVLGVLAIVFGIIGVVIVGDAFDDFDRELRQDSAPAINSANAVTSSSVNALNVSSV